MTIIGYAVSSVTNRLERVAEVTTKYKSALLRGGHSLLPSRCLRSTENSTKWIVRESRIHGKVTF